MTPKVKVVEFRHNYIMLVTFDNTIKKLYDMKRMITQQEMYSPLLDEVLFKSATVDIGGYGISWSDDIDISEFELWINGQEIF